MIADFRNEQKLVHQHIKDQEAKDAWAVADRVLDNIIRK